MQELKHLNNYVEANNKMAAAAAALSNENLDISRLNLLVATNEAEQAYRDYRHLLAYSLKNPELATKHLIKSKYQQIIDLSSKQRTKAAKCQCNANQKQFDCAECTQYYPVNVRRSKDGEEAVQPRHINCLDNRTNLNKCEAARSPQRPVSLATSDNTSNMTSFSGNSNSNSPRLKPSPSPISSTLLSLLALNKPSNTFIPPPNVTISLQTRHQAIMQHPAKF